MSTSRLAVFAKYWAPGQVKTRLAAGIGDQRAAKDAVVLVDPIHHVRGEKHFSPGQPMARVRDHIADRPFELIEEKIVHSADPAVRGLDRLTLEGIQTP
jgi:glycosyltransferase A (GT-A) superfamily protein (DUF2064 family)